MEYLWLSLFLISLVVLYLVAKQRRHLEVENSNLERLVEKENSLYHQVVLENRNLREIKHDYKKQLLINELYENEIKNSALSDAEHSELLIDVILKTKKQEAESKGIGLEYSFDISEAWYIDKGETISLFTNLLDNAIEAAEKVKTNPFVHISVKHLKEKMKSQTGFMEDRDIIITVDNSKLPSETPLDKGMATTKSDGEDHGFGTGIIKRIVESNKGVLHMEDNVNSFSINIYF